ncbi:hypothetical protein CEXT_436961 [Caerostris extrusa]|uniref:Uncharacterized protein n=1 Tax=Caerostris extrusa TaxID=172846 RepID=A0AAV4XF92_CAEEX|nr:hypothetical protein CEXT_436961 [Caerostris extrusa]
MLLCKLTDFNRGTNIRVHGSEISLLVGGEKRNEKGKSSSLVNELQKAFWGRERVLRGISKGHCRSQRILGLIKSGTLSGKASDTKGSSITVPQACYTLSPSTPTLVKAD